MESTLCNKMNIKHKTLSKLGTIPKCHRKIVENRDKIDTHNTIIHDRKSC